MPHAAAGPRIDPPVSVPIASGTIRAATAAPDPEEDPAAVYSTAHGLRTTPYPERTPLPVANSRKFNLPINIAPAELSRLVIVDSTSGIHAGVTRDPFVVGIPRVATM